MSDGHTYRKLIAFQGGYGLTPRFLYWGSGYGYWCEEGVEASGPITTGPDNFVPLFTALKMHGFFKTDLVPDKKLRLY